MPDPRAFDTGNPILAVDQLYELACTKMTIPGRGDRLVLTARTATATLTLFLTKDQSAEWRERMLDKEQKMTALVVPAPGDGRRP